MSSCEVTMPRGVDMDEMTLALAFCLSLRIKYVTWVFRFVPSFLLSIGFWLLIFDRTARLIVFGDL